MFEEHSSTPSKAVWTVPNRELGVQDGQHGAQDGQLGGQEGSNLVSGGESALFFAEGDVVSVLVEHKIDVDMVKEEVRAPCLCCFVCIYVILLTF